MKKLNHGLVLANNCLHIWIVRFDGSANPSSLETQLDSSERARACDLRNEESRRRFILRRAGLRLLLDSYADLRSMTVCYQRCRKCNKPHGQPRLEGESGLRAALSISGTRGCAMFGLTRQGKIGVDIEELSDHPMSISEGRSFLTSKECFQLESIPAHLRWEALLRIWTAKEACLKALGAGLLFDPRQIELTFSSSLRLGGFSIAPSVRGSWRLINHVQAERHVVSAVSNHAAKIEWRQAALSSGGLTEELVQYPWLETVGA